MLSKQLQEQIEQEGKDRMEGWHDKIKAQVAKAEYELGAEKYAALYEAALARAERAEKALKKIQEHIQTAQVNEMGIAIVIAEALTPKTGEDELHKES